MRFNKIILVNGPVWVVAPPTFTAPPSIIEEVKKILIEVGFDEHGHFDTDHDSLSGGEIYGMIISTLEKNGLDPISEDGNELESNHMKINYEVMA
jgi:hypothetical protein